MRLVRSMLWSPNIRLYRQFRRRIANPYQVYIETSSIGQKSIIKWRGRSFSASVPSDTHNVKKSRKKVSKDERKAMVESFVNKVPVFLWTSYDQFEEKLMLDAKRNLRILFFSQLAEQYKAMNAGKFPSAFKAMKEAGGSYYVIRQIVQELEYNSKMSSMDTKDLSSQELSSGQDDQKTNVNPKGEEFINRSESSINAAQFSGYVSTFDARISEDSQIYNENLLENQNSNYVATKSDRGVGEDKESWHSHPEKPDEYVKEDTRSEDMLKFDGLKPKAQQRKSSRELFKEPSEDAEPQGKSSVWENLKSLANGFLGIWRKH